MSTSILSTMLLVSPASPLFVAQPPSLPEPESGAWAVVHAGQLWVCWEPGPDCFERVVFDEGGPASEDRLEDEDTLDEELVGDLEPSHAPLEIGSEDWRLGFWGPRSLWIEHDEQRWRIVRGQRHARLVDDPAPVRLARIDVVGCGPDGLVPALIGGRLSFRDAPRCAIEVAAPTCVSRSGPRVRTPTPIRLKAGIEVAGARAWSAGSSPTSVDRRLSRGVELMFVVELTFDWQRQLADRRAASVLTRRGRAQLRELPAVGPGPLAAAEHEALAAVVCGGERQ